MPRCTNCKEKFEPKSFNRKFCYKDECNDAYFEFLKAQAIKKAEQDKRKHKKENITMLGYWSEFIQPLMNNIARLIDNGQPCIASGTTTGKRNGGHYHSTASNKTISLNLHNIHMQMEHSNNNKGGDAIRYRHGLMKTYSEEYAEYIDMFLMQCPTLNLTKNDLMELHPRLTAIKRRLEKLDIIYPAKVRIRLRDEINKEINIYQGEFASFKEYKKIKE